MNVRSKIRILIADDHAIVRTGLASLLNRQRDFEVVSQAKNGDETVAAALRDRPDVVIMDLMMPGKDGTEATTEIHATLPQTKILILTSFGTSDGIAHALQAGASGALVKTTENDELIDAIRRVAVGETVISPELENMMKNDPPLPELSPRQRAILQSMTDGLTSKEIGKKLGLKKDTIDKHINALLAKTGAVSRTQAVAIALRKHLLKI